MEILQTLSRCFKAGLGAYGGVSYDSLLFVGFDVIPQVAAEINAPKNHWENLDYLHRERSRFYLLIVFGVAAGMSKDSLKPLH